MPEDEKKDDGLERLRRLTGRLEEDPEEGEAIELLEEAVEEVERLGRELEGPGS